MKKRLQTILAQSGVASRRRAAELIESGKVKVDGRTTAEKGLKLDPERHRILVNGKPLPKEEKKYYFLLNKPRGVISTVKDTHNRKKITDFFRGIDARLYPVGRLDKDTTGIVLITNDGELAHRLSHPRFEVDKEYIAAVEGEVTAGKIARLEKGVSMGGKPTSSCDIKVIRKSGGRTVLRIKIHEGRKRQIRRMFEAVGQRVIELDRVRYAGLSLGGLKRGRFRALTKQEIAGLGK